jgi:predicted ribosomally synthesized peptide with SipW-like signal peptide
MSIIKRKKKAILSIAAVAVLIGGGAYAYFTATGSGSGTATVGANSALTVTGTVSGTLYPGTSNTINFTANNPSSGHQRLGTISLTGVHACTGASSSWNGTSCSNSGTEQTTCESFDTSASSTVDNFSMANVAANQDLASGNNITVTQTGTMTMNDLNSSQNACQSANLTLTFTAS